MYKMKCIDDPYEISGDYNSDVAANLQIVFDRCDPEARKCKSKEEIDSWLEFKYLVVLQNEEKYYNEKDIDERLKQHAIISQHAISTVRSDWPRLVSLTEIEYSNIPWGIGIEKVSETFFSITESPQRILPYKNNW